MAASMQEAEPVVYADVPVRQPTVVEALSAVMEEVQSVAKDDRNTQQNYKFRGVDAVVNAVGPALRNQGVVVVPTSVSYDVEHYTTKSGTPMRGVTATIGFRFYGPAGDYIDAVAAGEASDSGDKAMPKAHSVAYRTLLLQALCIPTGDPEPDASAHERGGTQPRRQEQPSAPPEATKEDVDALVRSLLLEGIDTAVIDAKFDDAKKANRGKLHPDYVADQTEKSHARLAAREAAHAAEASEPAATGQSET